MNNLSFPKTIFVEITNLCNFDCTFCPNHLMTRPLGMMDFELFKKIIADSRACGVQRFNLWLMGEPFLHPQLFDFIRFAKANNLGLSLISNAGLLQEELINRFLSLPFSKGDDILLSFLTPNSSAFQQRRAGKIDFENYKTGVFSLIERKVEKKANVEIILMYLVNVFSDVVKVPGLLTKAEDIHDALKELSEFSSAVSQKSGIDFNFSMPSLKQIENSVKNCKERKLEFLPGVFFNFKWLTNWGKVILPEGLKAIPSKNGFCAYPFETLGILWNGDMTICCDDYSGELVVGNLKQNSLFEVFYGEKAEEIRSAMQKGILLMPKCQFCQGQVIDQQGRALKSYYKKYYLARALQHLRSHGLKKTIKKFLSRFNINKF